MVHWLYPANTQYYDVLGAFAEKKAYWPAKTKVTKGDKVYLYLAAPHQQIGFVGEITRVDLTEHSVYQNIQPYFKKIPAQRDSANAFMEISRIRRIPIEKNSALSLSMLKEHGLRGMLMGPRNLDNNETLLQYIKGQIP